MTRFRRPVHGAALLNSPEMQLRHVSEAELEVVKVDEGVGTGFDNMDPSAHAERICAIAAPPSEWLACNADRLSEMGWSETRTDPDVRQFRRDADEHFQVQILPTQEFWHKHHRTGGVIARVSFMVSGTWPVGNSRTPN